MKLLLETSIRETRQMQDVLKDINLEKLFDLKMEQLSSNVWGLEVEDEEIMEDISTLLYECGLKEFELEIY
jgi:hypothetical protein